MYFENIPQFVIYGLAIIVSFTIHEYSHALASSVQGDETPKRYGRLTLNPLAHFDIIGFLSLFIFRFGWAKPVPISSYNYRNGRFGVVLTSIAGPFSNVLLCFFSILFIRILPDMSAGVQYFLVQLVYINAGLAVFNMLPVPPLDGSSVVAEIFGGRVAEGIYNLRQSGTMILFLLLWLPPVRNIISSMVSGLIGLLDFAAALIV
jgi:Zn-dependent protease